MKINIVSKQMPVTDAIRTYTDKKMSRIKKYFSVPIDITVTFSVQKNIQTVEVLVNAKGLYLKGVERSEDIYASLDLSVDKIEKQVAKYKDRLVGRKYDGGQGTLKMNVYELESIDDRNPEIIVTKHIDAKPMTVDEAVMQMDLLNKEFFVFRNEKGVVSVVYKRDDGNIGLIEP